ncbi:response regulator receiver domain-containing protein [Geothermobacter ehrlichii]|uniref:Response regulator receiver domain-containing protein n=1 Tax=Geothermobacter ehrlichii TaxID=213224 RepID=A0A5D3WMY6_9BACT|nr:response regulator [Geothermobacter ehrlichii]TYP00231.1 response regulator receiver domain-containing protein [Geothermobacter ehrlichii]
MNEQILVVDDEESIRFTFKYLLGDQGYQVETACSPEEALERISQREFDLIFLDLLLGLHSGLTLLKDIRQQLPNTPVVMVTGAPDEQTVSDAIRNGAFAYIPKPVRQDTLETITRKALDYRASLAGTK